MGAVYTLLIWNSAPSNASTPKTHSAFAMVLVPNPGTVRSPTTLDSRAPGPGNWVCFKYHTSARCTLINAIRIPGSRNTWPRKNREIHRSPSNSPPNAIQCAHVPTTGMDSRSPETIRTPIPESRSSSIE